MPSSYVRENEDDGRGIYCVINDDEEVYIDVVSGAEAVVESVQVVLELGEELERGVLGRTMGSEAPLERAVEMAVMTELRGVEALVEIEANVGVEADFVDV